MLCQLVILHVELSEWEKLKFWVLSDFVSALYACDGDRSVCCVQYVLSSWSTSQPSWVQWQRPSRQSVVSSRQWCQAVWLVDTCVCVTVEASFHAHLMQAPVSVWLRHYDITLTLCVNGVVAGRMRGACVIIIACIMHSTANQLTLQTLTDWLTLLAMSAVWHHDSLAWLVNTHGTIYQHSGLGDVQAS